MPGTGIYVKKNHSLWDQHYPPTRAPLLKCFNFFLNFMCRDLLPARMSVYHMCAVHPEESIGVSESGATDYCEPLCAGNQTQVICLDNKCSQSLGHFFCLQNPIYIHIFVLMVMGFYIDFPYPLSFS